MISFIVHGGAWNIPNDMIDAHRVGVTSALRIGWKILEGGGSAIDAVEQAIRTMEENPTFDAGRGSFVNAMGEIELDASIMNGTTLRCGAVASVQNIRNPITVARTIMEKSENVLLTGLGAVRFAKENGIPTCKNDDLIVGRELQRWKQLQVQKRFSAKDAFKGTVPSDTVGAVALDANGMIAAGTSTGGTPNKYPGRVGDSPLIGCGTYADSGIGGVSCTGYGEAIIKVVLAKTVIDYMEMTGADCATAATYGINRLKSKVDGLGGVIVLDTQGRPSVAFNTPRMARAYRTSAMNADVIEV
ncbi:MAG: isoaspartyl peptidase/L-asparaginase [Bacteriovoracaceae bacterium]|nr:isoaspartyl peptidase/L-asparaginase [Bacteroidota bacterium]